MNIPLYAFVAAALAAPLLEAQTVTIGAPNTTEIGNWGPQPTQAYGETFVVPAGTGLLQSFTFTDLTSNSQSFNYNTYIYAYNSASTPGAALYTGTQQTLPVGSVSSVITPNLTLTIGGTYIVFVSPVGLAQPNPNAFGRMGIDTNHSYADGTFAFAVTNGSTNVNGYSWIELPFNAAFSAVFGVSTSSFASIAGLDDNQRGIATSIDTASAGSGSAITHIVTALNSLPVTNVAGALDQLAPTKFNQFASSTAFNNATFDVADMDNYLDGERQGPNGTFVGGNGQVDTHNFVVNDPNVDPGLQMIHSRMLAWNDLPGVISDVPSAVLGGIDMKDTKEMKPQCTACTASNPWNVFLRGSVILAQDFSQGDVPHADGNTAAVTAGADYRLTDHLLVGATMSYAHTDATLDNFGSSTTVDSYSPGIYASYADGGWFANFIGRYSYNSYTENRNIAFLGQTANGGTDGNEGVIDLDGGYLFHNGPWSYGPVAGIQYTHLTVNGYQEQDSDANLTVDEDQSDSLRSRLGGEVRYNTCGCGVTFSPHLTATWQHEFMDQSRGLTSSFNQFGGGSFTVRTDDPSRDSALVDLGLDAKVNSSITVFGDYVVQAGQDNYFGQSLQAGVRIGF
jgi:uncharacterized protein YhjY with autotransporter beta-barrel domain